MPLELSLLMQLGLGHTNAVPVGDLPREVAEYLGCHPAVVYLGHDELYKIAGKHPEISNGEFQSLPYMIADGRYIADPKRPNAVTVFYADPETDKLFTAGLKSAEKGHEVWVSTLHRSTRELERGKLRRATLVRDYRHR